MYVTVPYNKVFFSILYFFNQPTGSWFWNCPRIIWCKCIFRNSISCCVQSSITL